MRTYIILLYHYMQVMHRCISQPGSQLHLPFETLFNMQSGKRWRNFAWLDAVQYVIAWSGKVGHQSHREQWSLTALLCRIGCLLHCNVQQVHVSSV